METSALPVRPHPAASQALLCCPHTLNLKPSTLDHYPGVRAQFCVCRAAFELQLFPNGTAHCLHQPKANTPIIITCVIIGVLVALLAALACAVWLYRSHHMQTASYKRAGPPGRAFLTGLQESGFIGTTRSPRM